MTRLQVNVPFDQSSGAKPKLLFRGDSITVLTAPLMVSTFKRQYNVSVLGMSGMTAAGSVTLVKRDAVAHPAIEVINLGTNDVVCQKADCSVGYIYVPRFSAEKVNGYYDQFESEFDPGTCVVFVTINSHNRRRDPSGTDLLNAHLRTKAHVVDWDALVKPAYFDTPENPHPNAEGQRALVAAIANTIKGCPAADRAPR